MRDLAAWVGQDQQEHMGELARRLGEKHCDKVNVVTHSMGGILVRSHLATNEIPNLGRVVMLGPPNAGSEVVDRLKDWSFFQALNGPAGSELGTDSLSTPNRLEPVRFELGVIAGDRSINGINSLLMIRGNDDGKMSVANTKVPGMKDHIVIHATIPHDDEQRAGHRTDPPLPPLPDPSIIDIFCHRGNAWVWFSPWRKTRSWLRRALCHRSVPDAHRIVRHTGSNRGEIARSYGLAGPLLTLFPGDRR